MKARRTLFTILLCILVLTSCSVSSLASWKTTSKGTRYYTSKKVYVKNKWYKVSGKWYYFDSKGYRKLGRFQVKGKYYYVTKKKGSVRNEKVGDYYYNAKGQMVTNSWITLKNGYEFYFGSDGKVKTGQFTVKGKTYFCDKKTGKVRARWRQKHYYDKDGVMQKNKWIGKSYLNSEGHISKGETSPKNPSDKDVRLLGALVYYEAGNQSFYGKQCVASVVVNRMKSSKFPNTLKGVINQSGQFSPAMNGCVSYLYNSNKKIDKDCLLAARSVLAEGTVLKGYYFFNAYSGQLKIGDHYFSKIYC